MSLSRFTRTATTEEVRPKIRRDRAITEQLERVDHRGPGYRPSVTVQSWLDKQYQDSPQSEKGKTRSAMDPSNIAEQIMRGVKDGYLLNVQEGFNGYINPVNDEFGRFASLEQKNGLANILRSHGFDVQFKPEAKQTEIPESKEVPIEQPKSEGGSVFAYSRGKRFPDRKIRYASRNETASLSIPDDEAGHICAVLRKNGVNIMGVKKLETKKNGVNAMLRRDGQKDSARLQDLLDSLNHSDLMDGKGKYTVDNVSDMKDWGWTHALEIDGTWYGEVRNTGWFCEESEGEDGDPIGTDEFFEILNQDYKEAMLRSAPKHPPSERKRID